MLPYYLFAFFVFILVCLVLLLWRFLFAGLKRERIYLEHKEEELHVLLQTLRKEADDFFYLAADKTAEISDERKRIAALISGFTLPQSAENEPAAVRYSEPEPVVQAAPFNEFRKAIEEAVIKQNEPPPAPVIPKVEPTDSALINPVKPEVKNSKREQITELLDSGKDAVQVAKELGITRNEVDLVVKTR
jgi:hypothetical protein